MTVFVVVIVLFTNDYNNYQPEGELSSTVINGAYHELSTSLTNERYTYIDYINDLPSNLQYAEADEELILTNGDALYDDDIDSLALTLDLGDEASYTIDLEEEGLYRFVLATKVAAATLNNLTLSIKINGQYLYDDHRAIDIPLSWMDESKDFQVDRYGDQVLPNQVIDQDWRWVPLYNNTYVSVFPLLFTLNEGVNLIEIENTTSTPLMVSDLQLIAPETPDRQSVV